MTLRILIVDDHEVVRMGIKALLSTYSSRFEVVAEAACGTDAIFMANHTRPDIVLMDVRLPGMSGIEAMVEILEHRPDTKVVILTCYAEDEILIDAIAGGASGYLLKQVRAEQLVQALDAVGHGESLLDPTVTPHVFRWVREAALRAEDAAFATLTDQELRVLEHVTEGLSNREIALQMHLSDKTVRNYVSSFLSKLKLSSRTEAAAYAIRHHIQQHVPSV